jgi:nitroreductase
MQIDGFLELARKRRSIRQFKADPVSDECINQILEAARWAMSGGNGQTWQYLVIKKKETKEKLAEIYSHYREISLAVELTRLEEYRQPAFRAPDGGDAAETTRSRFTVWSGAPVVIAVLGDRRLMQASTLAARLFEMHTFDQNLTCTAYAIHLAAASQGLGAQWLSLLPPVAEAMKTALGVPLELTLFNLNPVGYPAVEPGSHRRELGDLVHQEHYDMAKFMSNDDIREFILNQRKQHAAGGTYKVGAKEV